MNKEEENQRLMESIYDKGIHFKLDNGRTISIQQKRGTDSVRNKSVEVGTWVDDRTTLAKPTSTEHEYSEIKVYEYISLNELIKLLIKLQGE